jgi:hypothetical protein
MSPILIVIVFTLGIACGLWVLITFVDWLLRR